MYQDILLLVGLLAAVPEVPKSITAPRDLSSTSMNFDSLLNSSLSK